MCVRGKYMRVHILCFGEYGKHFENSWFILEALKAEIIHTLLTTHELFLLLSPLFLYEFFLLLVQTLKHQRTEWHARSYFHTLGTFVWENLFFVLSFSWIIKISPRKLKAEGSTI